MATFIHGIGASENIDSSGEVVSIAGLDISSLDKDGVFNYEHKSDLPAQVVGKVLKAKKIFSDKDCEDDVQLHFWNKVKVPYLYVMGELFDDYSDSAREVAGKFRYDADHKNTNERNVMNFSVEGSKISKEGITVTRSIARKITITVLACNKMAVAEMVVVDPKNPKKGEIDELFKTEAVEIEILTPKPNSKLWELLKKEDPAKHAEKLGLKKYQGGGGQQLSNGYGGGVAGQGLGGGAPSSSGGLMVDSEKNTGAPMNKALSVVKDHQRGSKIGMTTSGKEVYSHGMVGDYKDFSHKDHSEAAGHHKSMAAKVSATDNKAGTHHGQKYTLHMQAAKSAARKAAKASSAPAPKAAPASGSSPSNKYAYSPDPKIKKNVASEDMMNKDEGIRGVNVSTNPTSKSPEIRGQSGTGFTTKGKIQQHKETLGELKALPKPSLPKSEMAKAMTAGSGMASPDRLEGGAALAAESINGKVKKKSKLLQRAELEYTTWTKREEFESFMKSRMPSLTRGEIQVIGQTMLLQKSLKQEKLLKEYYNPSGGGLLGKKQK